MFATWEALVVADIREFEGVLERAVAIATFSTTSTTYTEWFITNLNLFQILMSLAGIFKKNALMCQQLSIISFFKLFI